MDNRITKRRLSDLLAYEWILMIIICVVSIVFWELAYDFGAVKLSAGQNFRYYYDYTIYPAGNTDLRNEIARKNTFSYDILKIGSEAISQDQNVLADRLSIQEGDIIFTDAVGLEEYKEIVAKGEIPENRVRAFSVIDTIDYKIASIDVMLNNAKKYLKDNFFVDGYDEATDGYSAENIDDLKVRSMFLKRNGSDNRFRSTANKNKGIESEKQRIVKLCENVEFMQEFINNPDNSQAIIRYTKFSQNYEFTKNTLPNNYQKWMQNEIDQGRGDNVYAINLGKLKGGRNITDFMQYKAGDQTDIVVMAFEFTSYQPHLQYESLSFICSTIRICTEKV